MKKASFLTACLTLCSLDALYGADQNPLKAPHKPPKPLAKASATTKTTVQASAAFKEVVAQHTFTDEREKGFPTIQKALGKGQTKVFCTKAGSCNLGIYIHTPQGAGKESFLKVVSRTSYPKEKKAIQLVYSKKAENFIVVPHHVFLFEDKAVLAMDRASGKPLLDREQWLGMSDLGVQNLARTVHRMWQLGIFHNDFNTANILFDAQTKTWKVVDTQMLSPATPDSFQQIDALMNRMKGVAGNILLDLETSRQASSFQKYLPKFAAVVQKNDVLLKAIFDVFPQSIVARYKQQRTEHAKDFLKKQVKNTADKKALKDFYALAWPKRIELLLNKAQDVGDPHAFIPNHHFFSRRNYRTLYYLLTSEYFVKPLL
ncbi:MAG: hypothetical protein V6Z78_01930 [Holosporaceae bacterium]